MKPLPQWCIESYAEGTGNEAKLARMVLDAQAEIKRLEEDKELSAKIARYWMDTAMELQRGQREAKIGLMGLAGVVKENKNRSGGR